MFATREAMHATSRGTMDVFEAALTVRLPAAVGGLVFRSVLRHVKDDAASRQRNESSR